MDLLVGALGLLAWVACAPDSTYLAKTASASGAGGAGGAMASSVSKTVTASTGGSAPIVEPPGPVKLTLVNGIVDEPDVRVCFMPASGAPTGPIPILPAAKAGLPFGAAMSTATPTEWLPAGEDATLMLLTGDLLQIASEDCASLTSSPPPDVSVTPLAILPGNLAEEEKSVVLALSGCVGGPGRSSEIGEAICGQGYREDTPTATVQAGFMSRIIKADRVPMQFIHASLGLGAAGLRLTPGQRGSVKQLIADPWLPGAIGPFPPFDLLSKVLLGDVDEATLGVYAQGSTIALDETPFQTIFTGSSLAISELDDGQGAVFVAIGASPTAVAGEWYAPFRWVAVPADP